MRLPIRQSNRYINGHFCYAYKFGIITNGLGIVRDITFYNKDFLKKHPDIVVGKKSDSPDEDKSLADSKALLPVLIDFFQKHPLINSKTFLGDAAFDAINIYMQITFKRNASSATAERLFHF